MLLKARSRFRHSRHFTEYLRSSKQFLEAISHPPNLLSIFIMTDPSTNSTSDFQDFSNLETFHQSGQVAAPFPNVDKFGTSDYLDARTFVTSVELHFLDHMDKYVTNQSKTYCLFRSLTGEPLEWLLDVIQSALSPLDDPLLSDWHALKHAFLAKYAPALSSDAAFIKLQSASMTSSALEAVQSFNRNFNSLVKSSHLPETFALTIYRQAVHPKLALHLLRELDELALRPLQSATERLATLNERHASTIVTPRPLYSRPPASKATFSVRSTTPLSVRTTPPVSAESIPPVTNKFDFSTIDPSNPRPWKTHLPNGAVSSVEKAFRAQKNLCRVCGSPDHQGANCDAKRQSPRFAKNSSPALQQSQ